MYGHRQKKSGLLEWILRDLEIGHRTTKHTRRRELANAVGYGGPAAVASHYFDRGFGSVCRSGEWGHPVADGASQVLDFEWAVAAIADQIGGVH
jgi:hypothetical protein